MSTTEIGRGWSHAIRMALVLLFLCGASGAASAESSGVLVRVGGDVLIPPGERYGPVLVIGGATRVDGAAQTLVAIGGPVFVGGELREDLVVIGGRVELGSDAVVGGDLVSVGGRVQRAPGATVGGDVTEVGPGFVFDISGVRGFRWDGAPLGITLLYVAGLFALALVVQSLWPVHTAGVARSMAENPWRSSIIGFAAALLLAPASVLLLITIVGTPLLWLFYLAVKMMGYVAAVTLIGQSISDRYLGDAGSLARLGVGVVALALLRFIPVLGWFVSLFVTLWSTGAVLDTKFGTNRSWLPPKAG